MLDDTIGIFEDFYTDVIAVLREENESVFARYTEEEFATEQDWDANPTYLDTCELGEHIYHALPTGVWLLQRTSGEFSVHYPAAEIPSYNYLAERLSESLMQQLVQEVANDYGDLMGGELLQAYCSSPYVAYYVDPEIGTEIGTEDRPTVATHWEAYISREDGTVWRVMCRHSDARQADIYQKGLQRMVTEDVVTVAKELQARLNLCSWGFEVLQLV